MLGSAGHPDAAFGLEFDLDDVRVAAHWAIFDVALHRSRRPVHRDHDFFLPGHMCLGNNVCVMASKKRRVVGGVVWDSGVGETCPGCGEAIEACGCVAEEEVLETGKPVRLSLDRKNRKGKAATVIEGVPLVPPRGRTWTAGCRAPSPA